MVLHSFILVTFTPLANALGVFFRPHFLHFLRGAFISGRLNAIDGTAGVTGGVADGRRPLPV